MKQDVRASICVVSNNSIFKEWTMDSFNQSKHNIDISYLDINEVKFKDIRNNYDLYLMDIHANYMDYLDLVILIKKINPNYKIASIIDGGNQDFINLIYKNQIEVMVSAQEIKKNELNLIIIKALNGQIYISENYKEIILQSARKNNLYKNELSSREIQITSLLGRGKSSIEIGAILNCSPKTVNVHRSNIKEKLKIKH